MFVLQLNRMTEKMEQIEPVACAESREALVGLLRRERVKPYGDGRFSKVFRQGGPLEWFNPPTALWTEQGDVLTVAWEIPAIVDIGTRKNWMENAGKRFDDLIDKLFRAPVVS